NGTALGWTLAANTAGYGDLLSGTVAFHVTDFNADGKADILFYQSGDGHWFAGKSDGAHLGWSLVSESAGFGNLMDPNHVMWPGDFTGDGKTDILFFSRGDLKWWLGASNGNTIDWSVAGTTQNFDD